MLLFLKQVPIATLSCVIRRRQIAVHATPVLAVKQSFNWAWPCLVRVFSEFQAQYVLQLSFVDVHAQAIGIHLVCPFSLTFFN